MDELQPTNPLITDPNDPAPTPPPNKPKSKLWIPILLLAVLGIAFVLVWYWKKSPDTAAPSVTSITTPEGVIDQVRQALGKEYKLLDASQNNAPSAKELSIRTELSGSPAYKINGYDFYTFSAQGASMDIGTPSAEILPTDTAKKIRTSIVAIYRQVGLTKESTRGGESSATDVYTGNDLVCTIDGPNAAAEPTSLRCGTLSRYAEVAAKAQPFAKVFPDINSNTALSAPTITDSLVSGYQRATVGVSYVPDGGGANLLFYRKAGGDWVYFAGAQSVLACSDYKTADLKNAFKGDVCVDKAGNESRV